MAIMTDFDLFWQAYPRKVGKGKARQTWHRIQPDATTVQKMLDALVWQRVQPQWLKDGGQFIPHPSTWLTQERWDDEQMHLPQLGERTVRSLKAIYGDGDVH